MKYDILVQTFMSLLVNKIFAKKILSPKIGEKKNCQNPIQAIIRLKKKWHGPLSHWCREGKTLVVRPLKKPEGESGAASKQKRLVFLGATYLGGKATSTTIFLASCFP